MSNCESAIYVISEIVMPNLINFAESAGKISTKYYPRPIKQPSHKTVHALEPFIVKSLKKKIITLYRNSKQTR